MRGKKGERHGSAAQVLEETPLRGGYLGVGPVVADPVAVAVEAVQPQGARVAPGGVRRPAAGLLAHPAVHHLDETGASGADGLLLDGGEREQRLAQGEGERGPDLEHGPVVADQAGEGTGELVVGRVGLEDHAGLLVEDVPQLPGALPAVVGDVPLAELDARLDDERHDAFPRRAEPGGGEGRTVRLQGLPGRGGGSGRYAVEGVVGAARHRDLGADDVAHAARLRARGLLGDPDEAHRPPGHHGIGEREALPGAGEAAVEVDLGEARRDIGADQVVRLGHGLPLGAVAPAVGAEVVAAEHDAFARQPEAVGEGEHQVAEARRVQPGVTAVLVHLVRRRLDQDGRAGLDRLEHGGLQYQGVRAADGGDAVRQTGFLVSYQFVQGARHVRTSSLLIRAVCLRQADYWYEPVWSKVVLVLFWYA
ncbi:hypothetical protein GA0115246_112253 [Streptomyces sp. SolWspMP-sol7th]|nr:hypothetical protein GA0115246_112253 [Streptomyces sp. SolWspMP-sol7th]